ncbi:MAG TPA: endonuclease/exonuclease/phosphatase family protein [Candidatus Hydrogenedentes bacterium]|jgi:endonuclease/exonuclease/phosphatase family metal-dependent hydrolase|nr:endonuclease/exonuclease/phosphatase family protein [Candidatus Hydrogenedentota bacterium]NLT60864.1 endonuclease/exonuclease/phosphatase family protein [Candidatus Hydrogenedentota bacterium]HNV22732.1 endonuclease/exonuclease/phosphatase family protein [Candidatus Hydrogenedentota bacterium]HNZ18276.1 endonuclease/exonuclease/phosphatase family protein [Candidatus Hydrogenedentota bacterium]HOH34841.1 endonuclease/exonuclease/phosphatase family protein [Candidatus Hydrogenedentota bacteri
MARMCIVLTLLASACVAQAEPITLNVMSFNIRFGTANDGENSWENRRDLVVKMLQERAPDIVGTQECLDFQADYIVAKLPEYRWFGVGREADASGERMAVLYKWQQFSPIEITSFWLSETPEVPGSRSWDSACPRMVTAVRFYHHGTRQFFTFCNTHFDHRSEPARQGAAQVLLNYVNSLDPAMPVVMTGDFNSYAGQSAAWSTLVQGDIRDAWLAAAKTAGPTTTYNGFEPLKEDADRRIDWVLVRGPIAVEHCETVVYEEGGHYASDHFAIAARLTITL